MRAVPVPINRDVKEEPQPESLGSMRLSGGHLRFLAWNRDSGTRPKSGSQIYNL